MFCKSLFLEETHPAPLTGIRLFPGVAAEMVLEADRAVKHRAALVTREHTLLLVDLLHVLL